MLAQPFVWASRVDLDGHLLDGSGFCVGMGYAGTQGRLASDGLGTVAINLSSRRMRFFFDPSVTSVPSLAGAILLAPPRPNPTSGGLRFCLGGASAVACDILDPSGRCVRSLPLSEAGGVPICRSGPSPHLVHSGVMKRIFRLCITALVVLAPAPEASPDRGAPVLGYEWLATYPHDSTACTQGLICGSGVLYEGTGLTMSSSLRKVEIETGRVLLRRDLPVGVWGEGITSLRDTLYQITYLNRIGYAYVERDSFELIETFDYPWEGWGLTHDGMHLIASDGSEILRFLDPRTREEITQVAVHDAGAPVSRLNELEHIHGRVYANVASQDRIAVIHPGSGAVEAWIDLGGLRDSIAGHPQAGVLNGIAFDPETLRMYVTGKYWPELFHVDVPTLHTATAEAAARGPALAIGPNPCRSGWLRLELPGEGPVSAYVFDIEGRLEQALLKQDPAGRVVTLRIDRLPEGLHLLRIITGRSIETRKLLVSH